MAMDAFFLQSGVSLPLLSDKPMLNFFQRSLKGGLAVVNTKHVSTEEEPHKSIQHMDLNNRKFLESF